MSATTDAQAALNSNVKTKAEATLNITIKEKVETVLAQFDEDNSKYKGKAYLTSGSRTWKEQLSIIINPKRKNNYLNIKARFKKKFDLKKISSSTTDMTADQLKWWKTAIGNQAGKSPGFPHVGGKAQDVSVKNLDLDGKKLFKKALEDSNLNILLEKVTGSNSEYNVAINRSNVFHITE